MAVSFEKLTVGNSYERPYLARLWGYKAYNVIDRGIIMPSDDNKIPVAKPFCCGGIACLVAR